MIYRICALILIVLALACAHEKANDEATNTLLLAIIVILMLIEENQRKAKR